MSFELHLGDCLHPVTGLASLADKSVDHVICDPPYEVEAHTKQRHTNSTFVGRGWADKGMTATRSLDFAPITQETRTIAAAQMARVSRRWILVFCQAEAVAEWRDALIGAGAVYKRACVWIKPDGQPQLSGDRPGMGYESIVAAHVPGRSRWNAGGKLGVYVVQRQERGDSTNGVEHPTKKPQLLMEALIRDFTDPGDLVCDPFAGSGTTGVAALKNGRQFLGWECNPKYHAAAMRRLLGSREQLCMFGGAA